jgi:hypothetical protein
MVVHWAVSLADMEPVACGLFGGGFVHMVLEDGDDVTDNWNDVDCDGCLDVEKDTKQMEVRDEHN